MQILPSFRFRRIGQLNWFLANTSRFSGRRRSLKEGSRPTFLRAIFNDRSCPLTNGSTFMGSDIGFLPALLSQIFRHAFFQRFQSSMHFNSQCIGTQSQTFSELSSMVNLG